MGDGIQTNMYINNTKIVIVISAATEKYVCAMKVFKRETTLLSKGNCTCKQIETGMSLSEF